MVGEHPTQTTLPGDDVKPAWRAACLAYRKVRRAGRSINRRCLPLVPPSSMAPDLVRMPPGDKRQRHYASVYHAKWLGTASAIRRIGSDRHDERVQMARFQFLSTLTARKMATLHSFRT
jgi:hypothetical protein